MVKDIWVGYRRYEALLAATNVWAKKRVQDQFRERCALVKQKVIDIIFFGAKNVFNYKGPFGQFNVAVAGNMHLDYARM
jgi:hypothetical protein